MGLVHRRLFVSSSSRSYSKETIIRGIAQRLGQFFALIGVVLLIIFFTGDVGGGFTGYDLLLSGGLLLLVGLWLIRRGNKKRRFRLRRGHLFGGRAHEDDDQTH